MPITSHYYALQAQSMLPAVIGLAFFCIAIELVLKGMALWRAGRNNHPGWFIALLLINSIGILPLIYLLVFDIKQNDKKPTTKPRKTSKK
jgi:methionyl-tRNA synthetase